MSGYLSGSTSLSVTDYCWWEGYINGVWHSYYGHSATASATVSVNAGSDTASYSITVTTSNYNFIQIYLKIGNTVVKNYKDTGGKKTYSYSGTTTISGGSIAVKLGVGCSQYDEASMSFTNDTLSRTYWSDVGAGSTSITDNYNNTFTATAYKGSAGTNNKVNKGILSWTGYRPGTKIWYVNSSNKYPTQDFTASSLAKTIDLADLGGLGTEDSRYVSIQVTTDGERNDSSSAWQYAYINQYVNPSAPGRPNIIYTKSKLTIREPWTISWTAATAGNTTSPVKGYRVRLSKQSPGEATFTTIQMKDSDGNNIGGWDTDTDSYLINTDSTSTSLVIDPKETGIKAKDKVKVSIYSYTRNGQYNTGTQMFNGNEQPAAAVFSNEYEVQNAGIVQVRTASGWHEGQVNVRTASGWHEAETVQPRAASGWHESE